MEINTKYETSPEQHSKKKEAGMGSKHVPLQQLMSIVLEQPLQT